MRLRARGDVLVYAELVNGRVAPGSGRLLSFARPLAAAAGGSVIVLVPGSVPADGAGLEAADVILEVSHRALSPYLPEAHALVLEAAIQLVRPDLVLLENTTVGLDLAATAAATADAPLVSYCLELRLEAGEAYSTSTAYGGRLVATVRTPLPAVFAIGSGALPRGPARPGRGERVQLAPPARLERLRTSFVEEVVPKSKGIDITRADRLVCIGRGIGSEQNVAVVQELAAALGAELAATRPVVDAGWVPRARLIGKVGATVKPRLYLALGISGAPGHIDGIRGTELIIAVNNDPAAAIFAVAHYGAVADIFDVADELLRLAAGAG